MVETNAGGALHALGNGGAIAYGRGIEWVQVFGPPYSSPTMFSLIAEEGGVALGYAYAGAFKGRPAYDWAVEVTAYVKMDFSGHGVSTLLYTGLERCLSMQNIINLNACITYPNEKSEAFHRKLGYKTVAHFTKCGYKSGAWKDMIWMEKFLCAHPAAPAAVIPFPEVQER